MSDIALRVENLGKRYEIGELVTVRDLPRVAARLATAPFRRLAATVPGRKRNNGHARPVANQDAARGKQTFWALQDVNFEVKHGEVLGVIGRNGAGKSTLLKVLSRITSPTTGRADIYGRVASLLEVGTGFHPDLTGRENVYLNGAMMGMSRQEINSKFDDIVAFAGVEKFIDTPVKRYSSGMGVRLGFAVAAHLEPEILIIDEVLAVGDVEFQERCLGRMKDVAQGGRTVLFVSHNMQAVQTLCNRAILIDAGHVIETGSTEEVILAYLRNKEVSGKSVSYEDQGSAPGNDIVRLRSAEVTALVESGVVTTTNDLTVTFEFWNLQPQTRLSLSMNIRAHDGTLVFNSFPLGTEDWTGKPLPLGLFRSRCEIPKNLLNDQRYYVDILFVLNRAEVTFQMQSVLCFDVIDDGTIPRDWHGKWPGCTRPILPWTTDHLESESTSKAPNI